MLLCSLFLSTLNTLGCSAVLHLVLIAGCTSHEELSSAGGRIMAASQALIAAARDAHNLKLAGVLMEVRPPLPLFMPAVPLLADARTLGG